MVSADNVNYDVLTLIFSFLSTTDLVSVCLVSRSFKMGATPRLYRAIWFRLGNVKRWPRVSSPFSAIVARPGLGVHVRSCEIDALPRLKGEPHPSFLAACAQSLAMCPNLHAFTYMHEIPPFLAALASMHRLVDLKIHAALATEQARALARVRGLERLSLHQASWNFCNALAAWVPTLAPTLASLTLAHSRYLNEPVLSALLPHLPALRGLHILGCAQVSHTAILRLVAHTPRLESLSLTTWENCSTAPIAPAPVLLHLRHLALDTRCTFTPHAVPDLYAALFAALVPCPLASFTFKLSDRIVVSEDVIAELVDVHGETLTRVNAVNATLTEDCIERICMSCMRLEQLAVVVPVKDMDAFFDAISHTTVLHTLIDVGDSHTVHGRRATMNPSDVRDLFQHSPALRTVISGNRCWTCERIPPVPTDVESMWVDDEDEDEGAEYKYNPEEYEIRLKLTRLRGSGRPAYELVDAPC